MNARADWLAARRLGIGGSDAAAILGASRYKTRADVWLDKTGRAPEIEENEPMRWGNILEPVVRAEYSMRTGRDVTQPPMMASEHFPWMLANLDGVAGDRILEIKTARSDADWGEPGTDEIPLEYTAQVHHYMIVSGLMVADVAVLIGGSDFRIYTVEADRELHQAMIEREREFWRLVETNTMPEPVDAREVQALFAKDNGQTVQASESVYLACQRLRDIKRDIKSMEEEKDAMEGQIKLAIGEAAVLELDGMPLATWKAAKDSMRFDAKAFEAEQPELFRKYQKTQPGSRRFLLK